MQWYTLLAKVEHTRNDEIRQHLNKLQRNPYQGVTLYCTFDVFGDWDICLWFSADDNDHAIKFVKDYIANIPGVVRTYTLPATPIKEYVENW